MKYSLGIDQSAVSKNWGFFLLWGILLLVLGLMAISASMLSTIISVVLIGVFLAIGGIIVIFDSFTLWKNNRRHGFFLHLVMGLIYLIVGIVLIRSPLLASVTLTLLLGIIYIILGVFRLVYSFSSRLPRWGWGFFSGLIALLLGTLILASWPVSGLYIIGLFVGIDLVFLGWFYIMAAFSARSLTQ